MEINTDKLTSPINTFPRARLISLADQGLGISLSLLLFSLPLAYITAVREIFLGLAVFFWVMAMVIKRRFLIIKTPLTWPLVTWVLVAYFSLFWAVNPSYSFKEINGEILKGLLVFYLVGYGINREDRIKQMYLTLILGNMVMVLYGLWDFWDSGGSLKIQYIRAGSLHSGYGTFGTYLITLFPFLLLGGLSPFLKKFRWCLWGLILLNIFCIYITFGRAMWLAFGIEALLIGFFINKKKVLILLFLGLIIFFFLVPKNLWFHGENLRTPDRPTSYGIHGTTGDLLDVWKLVFQFLKERPFQGIGFGRDSFSEAFTDFRSTHQPLLWHAHNTFLNLTLQTGIQGLMVFLWLVLCLLFYLFQKAKADPKGWSNLLGLSAGIMVIGFFVRNLFDDFYVDDSALLFWYLVGAALSRREEGAPL